MHVSFFILLSYKCHFRQDHTRVTGMIDQLYQKSILKYAALAIGHGKKEDATHILTLQNTTCGDKITVYVNLEENKITLFQHEVEACVLCQASSSILSESIDTLNLSQLQDIYDSLTEGLKAGDLSIFNDTPLEKLTLFSPVSDHPNRHKCVTLPLEAILKAIK